MKLDIEPCHMNRIEDIDLLTNQPPKNITESHPIWHWVAPFSLALLITGSASIPLQVGAVPQDSIIKEQNLRTFDEKHNFMFSIQNDMETLFYNQPFDRLVSLIQATISDCTVERIRHLHQLALDGDLEGAQLSTNSLCHFFRFMQKNASFSEPSIVLTDNGDIEGRWFKEKDKLLTIEFLSNGLVGFVLFAPLHRGKVARLTGITSPDKLVLTVNSYNMLD